MSRVAKKAVIIPKGVDVKIDGGEVIVKGPKGQDRHTLSSLVGVMLEDGSLQVTAVSDNASSRALSGTTRSLLNNIVTGVSEGFERKLLLVGVGYRAQLQGKKLNLTLGLSHPVVFDIPEGVTIETPAATEVLIKGINKQIVGQVSADIRSYRPPEPYKGKGIRYSDEVIILKETKKK